MALELGLKDHSDPFWPCRARTLGTPFLCDCFPIHPVDVAGDGVRYRRCEILLQPYDDRDEYGSAP
jgi:hypothetical protein